MDSLYTDSTRALGPDYILPWSLTIDDSPLDVFVTYESKRATDITISRYATRHLVAGEVRLV